MLNNIIYDAIGNKNNKKSVSDVDREVLTLGSMTHAGNEVNYPFTPGSGFLGLPRKPMLDSVHFQVYGSGVNLYLRAGSL